MSAPPVSVKGVLIHDGCVLLLANERGEWDLPGGRPDPGENHRAALKREARYDPTNMFRVNANILPA